ncbi:unnamed protein product [Phaedon cochleariae]|uniref:THAP-type domain-containing protein n=1 Tax=Phaedon cochleariae TaxID=80249 RepID=A0A9P0DN87_PHACE|nr:unnamed protein product [Phaedon cochleariae]
MVSCVSCRVSHVAKGISFHRLPSNPDLKKTWLEFFNIIEENLPRRAHVCSQHFKEDAFDRTFQKSTLKKDSLPTILISRTINISQKGRTKKRSEKSKMVASSDVKTENEIELSDTKLELSEIPTDEIKIENKDNILDRY